MLYSYIMYIYMLCDFREGSYVTLGTRQVYGRQTDGQWSL